MSILSLQMARSPLRKTARLNAWCRDRLMNPSRRIVLVALVAFVVLAASGIVAAMHQSPRGLAGPIPSYYIGLCDLTRVEFVPSNDAATGGGTLTPRVALALPPHSRCSLNAHLVLTVRDDRGVPLQMPGNPSVVHLVSAIAPAFIGAMWDFHYCGKPQSISYEFRVGRRAKVLPGGVLTPNTNMCQAMPPVGALSLLAACPKPLGHQTSIWRCRP